MSLRLTLLTTPDVPVEADCISPDRLAGQSLAEIERLPIFHGNRKTALADFFTVSGQPGEKIHLQGDLSRIKHIGTGMTAGEIRIDGDAGAHLGVGMAGGLIDVTGNAGDWVGPELRGGRIVVRGNAGHLVGSAYRGSPIGMTGGEIIIHGHALNEVGHCLRGGLIAVGGNCSDFAGVNMLAGTVIIFGTTGIRAGAGMKRGTIVALQGLEMLPTFSLSCAYHPPFLPLYLRHLRDAGLPVADSHFTTAYNRWCGDSVEINRGEILIPAAANCTRPT